MRTTALLCLASLFVVASTMPPFGGYGSYASPSGYGSGYVPPSSYGSGYVPPSSYGSGYWPLGGLGSSNPASGYGSFSVPGVTSLLPSPAKTVAKVKTVISSLGKKVLPLLTSPTNTTSAAASAIKKYVTAAKTLASPFQPGLEY
ncbi:uncharacterized protein LOC119573774 [Penaeus monodon]|uniref:uncharacterized protein LOC119573774 n=1 Tax=Penaeus monodon TaxID=6687 RepID=UPI0018A784AF|nr:uncharacterized protein LOC119573774 [Penaeus monodon]